MGTTMRSQALIGLLAAALGGAACVAFERESNPAAPTSGASVAPVPSLVGVWTSEPVDAFPSPNSCSNLQWRVTSQTPTSLEGEFAATT